MVPLIIWGVRAAAFMWRHKAVTTVSALAVNQATDGMVGKGLAVATDGGLSVLEAVTSKETVTSLLSTGARTFADLSQSAGNIARQVGGVFLGHASEHAQESLKDAAAIAVGLAPTTTKLLVGAGKKVHDVVADNPINAPKMTGTFKQSAANDDAAADIAPVPGPSALRDTFDRANMFDNMAPVLMMIVGLMNMILPKGQEMDAGKIIASLSSKFAGPAQGTPDVAPVAAKPEEPKQALAPIWFNAPAPTPM